MKTASEIILIGGSAGAFPIISKLLENLPDNFETAICIVIHRNKDFQTNIEKNLSLKLKRNIRSVTDKMPICQNFVYFAPAGYHLIIEPNYTFSLDISEYVHYSRPSIDVLFETAAQVYKDKCTAILLSGANSDGANGIKAVEDFNGKIYIQDPDKAFINTMPAAGKKLTRNPTILSVDEIIAYFKQLKLSSHE